MDLIAILPTPVPAHQQVQATPPEAPGRMAVMDEPPTHTHARPGRLLGCSSKMAVAVRTLATLALGVEVRGGSPIDPQVVSA